MKRRQDEDMMRQQDLIEKQKEQARYDSVSIASLHDWLVETNRNVTFCDYRRGKDQPDTRSESGSMKGESEYSLYLAFMI